MLDRLEGAGHIAREPSGEDRRVVLVRLTEENRRQRRLYDQVSEEMTGLFYEGFTWEEITEFENYLRRVFENLVRHGN